MGEIYVAIMENNAIVVALNDHDKKPSRDESPAVNSIQRIQQLVDTLKSEGIDPLFIYTALHQIAADLEPEAMEYGKTQRIIAETAAAMRLLNTGIAADELSTVIHSELHRAGLDELDPALLTAALRLLANDIAPDSPD